MDLPLPAQVRRVLEFDQHTPVHERRRLPRWPYHVQAELTLCEAGLDAARWTLFTRDVNPWSAGFVSDRPLPVYRQALVRLPSPEEQVMNIRCRVRRCRALMAGWYRGVIDFDREEMCFLV